MRGGGSGGGTGSPVTTASAISQAYLRSTPSRTGDVATATS